MAKSQYHFLLAGTNNCEYTPVSALVVVTETPIRHANGPLVTTSGYDGTTEALCHPHAVGHGTRTPHVSGGTDGVSGYA